MLSLKLLSILLLTAHHAYGSQCNGSCGQGQGDCDNDGECLDGLYCDFDGWWGDDFCRAGSDTVDYSWSAWGEFSDCSVQCGGDGTQERFRTCNPPKKGGYSCPSQMQSNTQACNNGPCPVDGGWAEFTEWSECGVSCGGGEHSRTRVCDNPAPEHGGADCTGDALETEACNENPCPIFGGWGVWSDWDECAVSCGGADQGRTRVCDNPAPQFGGDDCNVDGSTDAETQRCNENPCPILGGWGEWSEWDECAVSCGGADQGRTRVCDNPLPQFGGDDCTVDGSTDSETQRCNENPCPIAGGWGEWSEWDECAVSCAGADQGRTRVCDNPLPQFGGDDCTVDGSTDSETQRCNENPCPIAGGWGEWSEWDECAVSCAGADQGRTRVCDNPVPQFGGDDCTVDGSTDSETQRCNENPCPIDGGFSDWDEWGPCTVECGGGDQTTARRCDNPAPEFGGLECEGDFTDCQRCNLDPCPSTCPA